MALQSTTEPPLAERGQQTTPDGRRAEAAPSAPHEIDLDDTSWNGVRVSADYEVTGTFHTPAKPEVLAQQQWRERFSLTVSVVILAVAAILSTALLVTPGVDAGTKDWAKTVLASMAGGASVFLFGKLGGKE